MEMEEFESENVFDRNLKFLICVKHAVEERNSNPFIVLGMNYLEDNPTVESFFCTDFKPFPHQLYIHSKKSREESSGSESGVEILVNEPYTDGPGGNGQYTHKIYHIGSHLPGWIKGILPKSALIVEERAWNAYPYTKTIFRCPFVEKFTLEIETVYKDEGGEIENVFQLNKSDLKIRIVDYLDIVEDQISSGDYRVEEDPRLYKSSKTSRGPLSDGWRKEYSEGARSACSGKKIMCAYKLCRVEFKYWGMQSRIESFIHDIGLRKTMLRAHRQAWCWQDEYHGLTMADIRRLELETQQALKDKMAAQNNPDNESGKISETPTHSDSSATVIGSTIDDEGVKRRHSLSGRASAADNTSTSQIPTGMLSSQSSHSKLSFTSLRSKLTEYEDWPADGIEQLQASSSEEEEFFDAPEGSFDGESAGFNDGALLRSSSMDFVNDDSEGSNEGFLTSSCPSSTFLSVANAHGLNEKSRSASPSIDISAKPCTTSILFLFLHGGSLVDTGIDPSLSKQADVSTFKTTLDSVTRAHYPSVSGRIAVKLVSCPSICSESLTLLSSLIPRYSDMDMKKSGCNGSARGNFPLSAIPLLATSSRSYTSVLSIVVTRINSAYREFLHSSEGTGFTGQVCLIGDSIGSVIGYDILCTTGIQSSLSPAVLYGSNYPSPNLDSSTIFPQPPCVDLIITGTDSSHDLNALSRSADRVTLRNHFMRHSSCPGGATRKFSSDTIDGPVLDFEVSDFFMCGSPLGLVLAHRRLSERRDLDPADVLLRPYCHQVYNLYYSSDPSAVRIEPLIHDKFSSITPVRLPRYSKFPFGDGLPIHTVETLQVHREMFTAAEMGLVTRAQNSSLMSEPDQRRFSGQSFTSQISGQMDGPTQASLSILDRWWGAKRLDYSMYCPDGLLNLPVTALPDLLHASFWESSDVAAFILRQVVRQEYLVVDPETKSSNGTSFLPTEPCEKWNKKRTVYKLKNVAPNHRANDVIVLEGMPQVLTARLMYGPLDVVSLSGEKVSIHIMMQPPSSKWVEFGTETTDANGRLTYTIPESKRLPEGLYPVKIVVRGDHTSVDFYLAVIRPMSEMVIFSIDGSFTASMSILGKDPKVRAGAVDVVRHWQELGYLILYVTARPDMQHRKVVKWLAQHNFPHGLVAFMDGLHADPLKQKSLYLKQLVTDCQVSVHAAYGSSKDITVYQSIELEPHQIFVVGKVSKKLQKEATVILNGYASHLTDLSTSTMSKPALSNSRLSIRRRYFTLPDGQNSSKNPVRKTASLPPQASFQDAPALSLPGTSASTEHSNDELV